MKPIKAVKLCIAGGVIAVLTSGVSLAGAWAGGG
jgi:hypothetical protein